MNVRGTGTIERMFSPSASTHAAALDTRSIENQVTALFDEFRLPLLRYLSSFGLAQPDAEEVIQEVFLSLFVHLRAGKPRTNLRGWIFRVAHNVGLKKRKANNRSLKLQSRPEAVYAAQRQGEIPDPEELMASRQQQQRLLAAMSVLPEIDRRCLYLRAEGLRYREISGILGISLGGVALSLTRSLARLARCAGDE